MHRVVIDIAGGEVANFETDLQSYNDHILVAAYVCNQVCGRISVSLWQKLIKELDSRHLRLDIDELAKDALFRDAE